MQPMQSKMTQQPVEPGLRERIVEHSGELSRQQRVIADFLLARLQEAPFMSTFDIAEQTGASEATVVRFAQRIGYTGYAQLKMALVETLREERARQGGDEPTAPRQDIHRDSLAAVARLAQHNIARTVEEMDRRALRDAAAALFRSDHIFTFGLGISAHLADLAAYLFTEHGLRANSLATRHTSPREQLATLRASDVVLAFSFPPYSRDTLEVLQDAADRGVPTIAVTDRATAPAVALARHALLVSSQGMTFTSSTAAVDVLLDALVVEIGSHHRDETMAALARINRILDSQTTIAGDD
jgi:DNA-binding MurR/RpiR family transcriptional regulator